VKNPQLLDSRQNAPAGVASRPLVLESVLELFRKEADSSTNSMDVHSRLQDCIKHGAAEAADPTLVCDRAYQLVKEGLYEWLGILQKIAGEFVTKLATIAQAHPEYTTEDPASWARIRIKEFLDAWLDGWLNDAGAWTPSPIAIWFTRWSPPIVIWFTEACDGLDSGDCGSWCAPAWVEESRDLAKEPANLEERITPERTENLFRVWRRKFGINLDHGLEEAEHTTRVNLALQPAPRAATNQAQLPDDEPTIPVEGKKPRLSSQRESFIHPLLKEKGWSVLEWATNSKVDPHTAANYLKGTRNPYPSTIKKLADSLGIGIHQLPR
jgi:hypothetical protein